MNVHSQPFRSPVERGWSILFAVMCTTIFLFLVAPVLVIIPLSFNAEPYFTFSRAMLHLQADAWSLRWYESFFDNPRWLLSVKNSLIVGVATTALSASIGTAAALGLRQRLLPGRSLLMSFILAPMVVPTIVTGAGTYFVFAKVGLVDNLWGLIAAHTALGIPFVVVTVLASVSGLDRSFERAGAIMGAPPWMVFRKVTLPLIMPGVTAGAVLAFITSFDEVVFALFLLPSPQYFTLPRQMWSGLREQISPAILAAATLWIVLSLVLMWLMGALRKRAAHVR
ncbi:Spermidine/putrescine transport system permease protein PotC [Paraburkholderia ribeironis]|uniref:Spermidine/putrescine transport system permease protein PotC n=1 Tax=Paraburkholderia ribeironis TaxID=1247936 RepID=A0A1N7SCA4_9BURK|nr:ABC transporter permease [Paraburkholderia ribeironis]SIT45045.1 Spermidine/putrescine transport system permease protein PotC [Paraburkholderia ribeironis]